jgi:hypothetical protein
MKRNYVQRVWDVHTGLRKLCRVPHSKLEMRKLRDLLVELLEQLCSGYIAISHVVLYVLRP